MSESRPEIVSHAHPARRRSGCLSALLYLLVFVSGLVCGAGLTAMGVRRHLQQVVRNPELGFRDLERLLERRLRLTPAQSVQVRAILKKRQLELQQVRRLAQPHIEREFAQLAKEIDQVLTPDQRRQWHLMTQRMKHWLPPPPPRPPKPSGVKQT